MFNVKAVVREIEAEENLKNEHTPRAKRANPANVSHFNRFSRPSASISLTTALTLNIVKSPHLTTDTTIQFDCLNW